MGYTIGEVSRRTGLTASTLRYYETEQLLTPVRRDGANRREYGQQDLEWLSIITCLKNTGMPIQDIRRFVTLCGQGDGTLAERYRIVLAHREASMARIAALQKELAHIDYKVAYYRAACEAGSEAAVRSCLEPWQGDACAIPAGGASVAAPIPSPAPPAAKARKASAPARRAQG